MRHYAMHSSAGEKRCTFCGRCSSPEWRRGPQGNRTLCNACGLRYARSISAGQRGQRGRRDGQYVFVGCSGEPQRSRPAESAIAAADALQPPCTPLGGALPPAPPALLGRSVTAITIRVSGTAADAFASTMGMSRVRSAGKVPDVLSSLLVPTVHQ